MAHLDQNLCWSNKTLITLPKPTHNINGKVYVTRKSRVEEIHKMSSCIQPHTIFPQIRSPLPYGGVSSLSLKPSRERRNYFAQLLLSRSSLLVFVGCVKDLIFCVNLDFYCFLNSGFYSLNQNMKRACFIFDQSRSADEEAKEKLKYQTLLKEYLEQQKEFVARKKKLQAAKQKRELVLAEVRFLKRKHKSLLQSQAPKTDKTLLHLPNMDKETNTNYTMQGGRNPGTIDQQLLLSNSRPKDDEAEGRDCAYEEDVRCTKEIKNHFIQDKVEGKRKFLLA